MWRDDLINLLTGNVELTIVVVISTLLTLSILKSYL